MKRYVAFAALVLVVLGCRPSSSSPSVVSAGDAGVGPTPAPAPETPCTETREVHAAVRGTFFDSARIEIVSDVGGTERAYATERLSIETTIARPYALEELCRDEGTTDGRLRISCIKPGRRRLILDLDARQDGSALVLAGALTEPRSIPLPAGVCLRFAPLPSHSKLEELTAPGAPASRCASVVHRTIAGTLEVHHASSDGGKTPLRIEVAIPDAKVRRDLVTLTTEPEYATFGAPGGQIVTIGDATVYQHGESLFYTTDPTHVAELPLPCGSELDLDVKGAQRIEFP
jgi:hypothetical protein